MKSFTNIEKIIFLNIFTFRDVLFTFLKCALLKAQAELKRNNYDKGHETFLHSNQISMIPALHLMQILLDPILNDIYRQCDKTVSVDFVVELCSFPQKSWGQT